MLRFKFFFFSYGFFNFQFKHELISLVKQGEKKKKKKKVKFGVVEVHSICLDLNSKERVGEWGSRSPKFEAEAWKVEFSLREVHFKKEKRKVRTIHETHPLASVKCQLNILTRFTFFLYNSFFVCRHRQCQCHPLSPFWHWFWPLLVERERGTCPRALPAYIPFLLFFSSSPSILLHYSPQILSTCQ